MKKIYLLAFALFMINGAICQSNNPCMPCLQEGITFTTQSEVDNFRTNYPACTEIQGDVTIESGTGIVNLLGLFELHSIGGNLTIEGNQILTNLSGLNSLHSIGGDLRIYNNNALTSLIGLDGLTSIDGSMHIGGNYWFGYNEGNAALTSLMGLENVTSIGGELLICNNYSLTNLIGMNSLVTIGGEFRLGGISTDTGGGGTSLTSLTGLENLTSIGGNFFIGNNDYLTDFSGLENLTSIGGDLQIGIMPNPVGFSHNLALTSLTGLENLTSIGGSLEIYSAWVLTSLTGLDGLTIIGDNLEIGGEFGGGWGNGGGLPSLTSITGIENVTFIGGDLNISLNELLSYCAVQSICQYLASPNGSISIYGNATGCNSQQEVEDACGITSIENLTPVSSITIYPNPTSATININIPAKGTIIINNISGQQLLQQEIINPTTTIDVSELKSGMYVVKVVGEKGVQVGKVLKE